MSRVARARDETTRRTRLHFAHIVDVARGPLVGEQRFRRVAPFALTSVLSLIVAVPGTSWVRPGLVVAGLLGVAVTALVCVVVPWSRLHRRWQLLVPALFLVATLLLIAAAGHGFASPFSTLTLLPLLWLAIYESRWAVVSVGAVAGLALWLLVPVSEAGAPSDMRVWSAVFVICAVGMGSTLQALVAETRRASDLLREQMVALEDAALMLDVMPEYVSRYRLDDHVITYCNATWSAEYNTTPDDAVGQPLERFISDDELTGLTSQLARLGPDCPVLEDVAPRAAAHKPDTWLHWIDRYLVGPDGDEVLSIGRDVTARRRAEVALAASEERYRELADRSTDVVWRVLLEPSLHFDYISPSVQHVLGHPPAYFMEDFSRMLEILDDASRAEVARALEGNRVPGASDFHFRHASGSIVVAETRTTAVTGGVQGVSRDVTELRRLQADVAALALRDPLTGLANRRLLEELLDAELSRTSRIGVTLAIAFLDLDGFKAVNDAYGHACGDAVLCETARRLLHAVRDADTVARLGGDEFVIVYEKDDPSSERVVARIAQALSPPIQIGPTVTVSCPASIGLADTDTFGYDRAALLDGADREMYRKKRARSGATARTATGMR